MTKGPAKARGLGNARTALPWFRLLCVALSVWATLAAAQEPTARFNHTAVWTGTEMIVWGGRNASGALDTGGRYNPTTRVWTPINTSGAPSPREDHAAVWTGTEMVVWGGQSDGFTSFNDGARYHPGTDTWTPMTTSDTPTGRAYHSGVWTGTHFIPWGGVSNNPSSGEAYRNSGARYSPGSDSWVATTNSGAPLARANHKTVWTGSGMIVWGGLALDSGSTEPLKTNTGGIYTPSGEAWSATATLNAPTGRASHTAIWTGARMIVWGGVGLNTATDIYNSGGRYDPVANNWSATSTNANVPNLRQNHTAVWTGTEMIVWGGQGSIGNYRDNGGRYNPNSDAWASMTTGPAARAYHTAIWTGSEMIVWGGNGFAGALQGLGRYRPAENTWNTAPLCSLTAPAAGAMFVIESPIDLTASASDPGGAVSQVEFFANGSLLHTDPGSPYAFTWTPAALGTYTLTAVATDTAGLKATSAPVAMEVVLRPKLTPTWISNHVRVQLLGETNRSYLIERSSNLVTWLPFKTNIATNGTFTFEDPSVTNVWPARYYRAIP